jgi:hypothetical protein
MSGIEIIDANRTISVTPAPTASVAGLTVTTTQALISVVVADPPSTVTLYAGAAGDALAAIAAEATARAAADTALQANIDAEATARAAADAALTTYINDQIAAIDLSPYAELAGAVFTGDVQAPEFLVSASAGIAGGTAGIVEVTDGAGGAGGLRADGGVGIGADPTPTVPFGLYWPTSFSSRFQVTTGTVTLNIRSLSGGNTSLSFGDSGSTAAGSINYSHDGQRMDFGVEGDEKLQLLSAETFHNQRLLVRLDEAVTAEHMGIEIANAAASVVNDGWYAGHLVDGGLEFGVRSGDPKLKVTDFGSLLLDSRIYVGTAPQGPVGNRSIAIGENALQGSHTGNDHIAIGQNTLGNPVGALQNIAIGNGALRYGGSHYNVAIGQGAMGSPNNTGAWRSVAIGVAALASIETGHSNTAVGANALGNLAGGATGNMAVGQNAGNGYTGGIYNAFIGYLAGGGTGGGAPGTGSYNTAIGNAAMGKQASSAAYNVAIGRQAMLDITTGLYNTGNGSQVMEKNQTGSNNVGFGYRAMAVCGLAPAHNVIIGSYAGENVESTGNVALGNYALRNLTTGSRNIAIGYSTGDTLVGGSNNVLIGYNIEPPDPATDGYVIIGSNGVPYLTIDDNRDAVFAGNVQGDLQTKDNAVTETIVPDSTLILYDAAGTAYKVPCVAA